MTQVQRRGFVTYPLPDVRRYPSHKVPAPHQEDALRALRKWMTGNDSEKGGILVLPTGGGKTFTATRFLTEGPLTQGHKVVWLAHTHHLLDQAFSGFGKDSSGRYEVGHIGGQREKLTLRTVSGTLGHGRVAEIQATDDVLIITLQTLARAMKARVHPGLQSFLKEARQIGLTVVFDECHHAPAPTFRKLIEALREEVPDLQLLGLTATPTYTDERRQGYLRKLFPQSLLYQADLQSLIAAGVLARPIVEEPSTSINPEFSEHDYQEWLGSYRDIPEKVIAYLASHRTRNAFIADTYVQNREKYGQTIIFADRWYQCTALVELLRQRGVRADAIFTHQEANPGSVEARSARSASENEAVLARFKQQELDVLVNIRMLTEGTDVPSAKTVFLTRQTTSRILLTQMIGRALRGPKFGGTDEAYVVAFIDEWKQHINWARWDDLVNLDVEDETTQGAVKLPVEVISIDLVAHLAREMDVQEAVKIPFLTLLPVGWYVVNYDAAVQPKPQGDSLEEKAVQESEAANDDVEVVSQLIPVFSQDQAAYMRLFHDLEKADLSDFDDIQLGAGAEEKVRTWVQTFFTSGERLTRLQEDVQSVIRHRALHGSWPKFTPFEARKDHDIDALAERLAFQEQLSRVAENTALRAEFESAERLWNTLYRNYDQFKRQYDASVNRLLYLKEHPEATPDFGETQGVFLPDEVPQKVKNAVRRRDRVCLCCGSKTGLQVDHIRSRYAGGNHDPENLQLLCGICNRLKGTREIDFRKRKTPLISAAQARANAQEFLSRNPPSNLMSSDFSRAINLVLECRAVTGMSHRPRAANRPAEYEITLIKGNDPSWVQPFADEYFTLCRHNLPASQHPFFPTVKVVSSQREIE
ncbi:DEAD/DEAH box helicase family protein [Deinococcus sp. VB343]|uniref:DEAD/DEAH box helicase family protein n=1 Tax=Deinococcus sp. VB142 TaxID=3112952 RepID=A0AAU6Q133_9DEIO